MIVYYMEDYIILISPKIEELCRLLTTLVISSVTGELYPVSDRGVMIQGNVYIAIFCHCIAIYCDIFLSLYFQ